MQVALNTLAKNRRNVSSFTLSATHYYIKFIPSTEEELDRLKNYSDLILYDYPLDYEIIGEGSSSYRDPDLKEDQPTYQYASVPVDYDLPKGIKYELLENLFIPDEYNEDGSLRIITKLSKDLIEDLVTASLVLTDNVEETKQSIGNKDKSNLGTNRMYRSSWQPAGQILFVDTYEINNRVVSRNSPLVGAKVRARRWATTHEGLTDNNGNFSCNGTFKRDANYSIKWERQDFDLRSGTFGQAIFNGPKQRGDWNLTISSGESRMYAIVHTAAQQYYYGNRFGLKSPPTNGFWNSRLKIAVYNKRVEAGHCKDCRTLGAIPRLYIGEPNRTTDAIYGTTIHEISHSSHWELRRGEWNNNNTELRLKESWSQGVEWLFTTNRYMAFDARYVFDRNFQDRTPENDPIYTSLVVDLNDNFNQSLAVPAFLAVPVTDRVSGYTLPQMEQILNNTDGFNQFREQLEIRYSNPTEQFLVELFNNWN
jgi:hypothetical protein